MTQTSNAVPKPGSDEARALGCRCPIWDNHRGTGSIWGANVFVMRQDCPMHGWTDDKPSSTSSEESEAYE